MTAYNSGAFTYTSQTGTSNHAFYVFPNPSTQNSFFESIDTAIISPFNSTSQTGISNHAFYRRPLAALHEVAGSRKQSWVTFG